MVVKFSKTFVYCNLRQSLQSIQELLCTLFGFIFVAIFVAYHWYKTYSVIQLCQLFAQLNQLLTCSEHCETFSSYLEFELYIFTLAINSVNSQDSNHILFMILVLLKVVTDSCSCFISLSLTQPSIHSSYFNFHCNWIKPNKLKQANTIIALITQKLLNIVSKSYCFIFMIFAEASRHSIKKWNRYFALIFNSSIDLHDILFIL